MSAVENFNMTETETETESETKSESKPNNNKESPLKTELREYQKNTLELFGKEKLELPSEISTQIKYVNDFLRKAKEDKQPIQKVITYMKRIPKVVRDSTGKAGNKDFLEVHSELWRYDRKNNILCD